MIIIAFILLALAVLVLEIVVIKLVKRVRKDEELLHIVAETFLQEKKKDLLKNFAEGLENLFNPKDKKDVKKTRTNRKTK